MVGWGKRLAWAAAAAAALTLGACGQKAQTKGGELHLYNWSDYIDPKILTDFTQEPGSR
jgi:putrescine transport system substrate-binding protein